MNRFPSRLWARLSLVSRVSLLVALSTIVVAIIAAFLSATYFAHKAQDEITAEYNQQMDMQESMLASTIFFDLKADGNFDRDDLAAALSDIKYGPDVSQINFRNTSDVATYNKDINLQLEAPLFFSRLCGLETLKFNRPITVNTMYFGVLTLSMSPNRIINQAWEQYQYLVQVMFISLALILFLIWIVLRKALYPLYSLAEAGKSLARGDLSARVQIAGGPELRVVQTSFNQMASSIEATLSALQESEEKFRQIAETINEVFFSYDPAVGKFLYVSPAYEEIWQKPVQKVYDDPLSFTNALHPKDRECFLQALHREREEGEYFNLEYRIVRPDGTERQIRSRNFPIGGGSGFEQRVVGIAEDITERKRAEDALKEAERVKSELFEKLNTAQHIAEIGSWEWDLKTNNVWWSDETYRIFGVRQQDFVPSFEENGKFIHPDDFAIYSQSFEQSLQTGQPLDIEIRLVTNDGQLKTCQAKGQLFYDDAGQQIRFSGTIMDITKSKQAEEKLKSALQQTELLIRELFHRTKNNMQVIISMLMLQAGYTKDFHVLKIFRDIQNRIQSMALVHEKLYESQNLSSIRLDEYIRSLADLLMTSYNTSPNRIKLFFDMEEISTLIDIAMPSGLVFNELLTNAIEHAFPDERNGKIQIRLHQTGQHEITLEVEDDGVGVPVDFDFRQTGTFGMQILIAIVERQLLGRLMFQGGTGVICRASFRDDLYRERI